MDGAVYISFCFSLKWYIFSNIIFFIGVGLMLQQIGGSYMIWRKTRMVNWRKKRYELFMMEAFLNKWQWQERMLLRSQASFYNHSLILHKLNNNVIYTFVVVICLLFLFDILILHTTPKLILSSSFMLLYCCTKTNNKVIAIIIPIVFLFNTVTIVFLLPHSSCKFISSIRVWVCFYTIKRITKEGPKPGSTLL